MVRALLAATVPCLAIGLTGLIVTTIGRTRLAMDSLPENAMTYINSTYHTKH